MTARHPLPALRVRRPSRRTARDVLGGEKAAAFVAKQKAKAAAAERRKALRVKPGQVITDPTPEQAAFAADELREVLTMLGPGRATFYRDGSSNWHDAESRNEIRARIARLDEAAGRPPLIPSQTEQTA